MVEAPSHNDEAADNHSTGPTPKKPSNGPLGLRELIAVAQARRLRGKELVSAAVKVYGGPEAQKAAPPHVDRSEVEHFWAGDE